MSHNKDDVRIIAAQLTLKTGKLHIVQRGAVHFTGKSNNEDDRNAARYLLSSLTGRLA